MDAPNQPSLLTFTSKAARGEKPVTRYQKHLRNKCLGQAVPLDPQGLLILRTLRDICIGQIHKAQCAPDEIWYWKILSEGHQMALVIDGLLRANSKQ